MGEGEGGGGVGEGEGAQGGDGGLVVALDHGAGAAGDLAGALGGEDDEGETVADLFEAVFDGDAGQGGPPGA